MAEQTLKILQLLVIVQAAFVDVSTKKKKALTLKINEN